MEAKLLNELQKIEGLEVKPDTDLGQLTTMRLIAKGDLLIIRSLTALCQTIKTLTTFQTKYTPIGLGANTIISEIAPHPYLKLDLPFNRKELEELKEEYVLPASLTLGSLSKCASTFGLKGWEVFTGIPASLGGAIFMNAGTNLGEIGSLVKKIRLVNNQGEIETVIPNETTFSYRKNNFLKVGDVVFEVTLGHKGIDSNVGNLIQDYLKKRAASQPLSKRTCGCVFKNRKAHPACRAGQSLDIIGFKGFTYKNIRVSPVHANFFEHEGGASRSDLVDMAKIINEELRLQMGVTLEFEVRV